MGEPQLLPERPGGEEGVERRRCSITPNRAWKTSQEGLFECKQHSYLKFSAEGEKIKAVFES